MARISSHDRSMNIIKGLLGFALLFVVFAVLYTSVFLNTERRSRASLGVVLKGWDFVKSGDAEGWTDANLIKYIVNEGMLKLSIYDSGNSSSPQSGRFRIDTERQETDRETESRIARRQIPLISNQSVNANLPIGNKQVSMRLKVYYDNINYLDNARPRTDEDYKLRDQQDSAPRVSSNMEKPIFVGSDVEVQLRYVLNRNKQDRTRNNNRDDNSRSNPREDSNRLQRTLVFNVKADGTMKNVTAKFPDIGEVEIQSLSLVFPNLNVNTQVDIDYIHFETVEPTFVPPRFGTP